MRTDAATLPTGLVLRVRRLIEEGRLPVDPANQIDACYGGGAACCLCDQPIAPTQVEYDYSDSRTAKSLSFHFPCYAIWQRECKLRAADSEWAKWAD